jgi:hypothetical protein
MIQSKQKEILIKLGKKVKPHLVKLELIVLLLFALSIILRQNGDSQIIGVFLMIGCLTLSLLYFLIANAYSGDNKIERAASFMIYYALSIALIGCLFVVESLPGGFIMTLVGGGALMLMVLVSLFLREKLKLKELITMQVLGRMLVVLFLSAFLYLAPAETLRTIKIVPYEDFYSNERVNNSIVEVDSVELKQDSLSRTVDSE